MGFKFIKDPDASYVVIDGIISGSLYKGDPRLTPHFRAHEFACPDCKIYKVAVKTLEGLENVRVKVGVPLKIANTSLTSMVNSGGSGYRCPKHNAETPGSSPHSRHMRGLAVDVHPTGGLTVLKLYHLMEAEPVFAAGGLGLYKNFVHGDCSAFRRWQG